ncbi:MAG: hypothetical protein U0166_16265 [Acidobacteriota bacterium]
MKRKVEKARSEAEIDAAVEADSEIESAWGKAVKVGRSGAGAVPLPAALARRAEFVARLHRKNLAEWLAKIVEERLDLEEAAFAGAKRELRASSAKR